MGYYPGAGGICLQEKKTGTIQVMRYVELADTLRDRIVSGARGALASEAELGREYGVSRVTVRRALELLRDEGLVSARQGVGWFVAVDPVRQSLGRVTTVEAALEAAGAEAGRRVLEFAFEPAPPDVAKTLDLPADGEVLRVTRLNLGRRRAVRDRDGLGARGASART